MKKTIGILAVLLCFFSINVSAVTLGDMTEILVKKYNINYEEDDLSGISRLQNRRNLKKTQVISVALKNDIISVNNGLFNEDGKDYTPIINGLIKKYVNDNDYRFLSGGYVDLVRNKNIVFNNSTFYVTENSSIADINYTDTYTCITDRNNNAVFVWKSADIKQPSLYRVKLYWAEGEELIVTEMHKKHFDMWLREKVTGYAVLNISQVDVGQDYVLENLDKYIYVFADDFGGEIIVKGISD